MSYTLKREYIAKDPLDCIGRFSGWLKSEYDHMFHMSVLDVDDAADTFVDILECTYRIELACQLAREHKLKDSKALDEFIHGLRIPYIHKYSDIMKLKEDMKGYKKEFDLGTASHMRTYGYGSGRRNNEYSSVDSGMLAEASKRGPDVLQYTLEEMPELARYSSSTNKVIVAIKAALQEYDDFVDGKITLDEISDEFFEHKGLVRMLKDACKEKLTVIALGEFGKGKDARSVLDSNKRKILDAQIQRISRKISERAKKVAGHSVSGMSDEDFEKKMRDAASML